LKKIIKKTIEEYLQKSHIYYYDKSDKLALAIINVISNSIDQNSRFYKNCYRNRCNEAKICNDCPFKMFFKTGPKRIP